MVELADDGRGGYKLEGYSMSPLAKDVIVDGNISDLEKVADAMKLADTFKQVAAYWEAHNAADAVGFAKKAQDVAMAVAKSSTAGNMDQAAADAKTMGANCGGCHMAHREKTDTGFKIK